MSHSKIVWNRRWLISEGLGFTKHYEQSSIPLHHHLLSELKSLSNSLWSFFDDSEWIDKPALIEFSKLEILSKAQKIGINIPNTLVTNEKRHLKKFLIDQKRIIVKSISDSLQFSYRKKFFQMYTSEVLMEDIDTFDDSFFPSFFQELLEKEYEIRTFFIGDKFYSMAIFSQNDEQTKIDFRNYNFQNFNRFVPYNLPLHITAKLRTLVTDIKLKSGSIDLVRTTKGEYVFLEINPVGQFGMVSKPCNYYLEKEVAKFIIKQYNEKSEIHRSNTQRFTN
jgi:ATP-GRASP peptide maturase of grasp-with-spasm system